MSWVRGGVGAPRTQGRAVSWCWWSRSAVSSRGVVSPPSWWLWLWRGGAWWVPLSSSWWAAPSYCVRWGSWPRLSWPAGSPGAGASAWLPSSSSCSSPWWSSLLRGGRVCGEGAQRRAFAFEGGQQPGADGVRGGLGGRVGSEGNASVVADARGEVFEAVSVGGGVVVVGELASRCVNGPGLDGFSAPKVSDPDAAAVGVGEKGGEAGGLFFVEGPAVTEDFEDRVDEWSEVGGEQTLRLVGGGVGGGHAAAPSKSWSKAWRIRRVLCSNRACSTTVLRCSMTAVRSARALVRPFSSKVLPHQMATWGPRSQ